MWHVFLLNFMHILTYHTLFLVRPHLQTTFVFSSHFDAKNITIRAGRLRVQHNPLRSLAVLPCTAQVTWEIHWVLHCNKVLFFMMKERFLINHFQLQHFYKFFSKSRNGRCQRLRGLRHGSVVARMLVLRARIPPGANKSISCGCCVLLCRGLCVWPITRSDESYRV